jgi:hypothetical protein
MRVDTKKEPEPRRNLDRDEQMRELLQDYLLTAHEDAWYCLSCLLVILANEREFDRREGMSLLRQRLYDLNKMLLGTDL